MRSGAGSPVARAMEGKVGEPAPAPPPPPMVAFVLLLLLTETMCHNLRSLEVWRSHGGLEEPLGRPHPATTWRESARPPRKPRLSIKQQLHVAACTSSGPLSWTYYAASRAKTSPPPSWPSVRTRGGRATQARSPTARRCDRCRQHKNRARNFASGVRLELRQAGQVLARVVIMIRDQALPRPARRRTRRGGSRVY